MILTMMIPMRKEVTVLKSNKICVYLCSTVLIILTLINLDFIPWSFFFRGTWRFFRSIRTSIFRGFFGRFFIFTVSNWNALVIWSIREWGEMIHLWWIIIVPFCFLRSSASFFLLSLAAILPPSNFFLSSLVSPAPSTLESSLESFEPLPSDFKFWFFDSIKSFFLAFFSLRSAAFALLRSSLRFLRRSSSCFRRASRAAFFLSFFARINSIYYGLPISSKCLSMV